MNLIANTNLFFMLFLALLCTDMRIDLILIDFLQRDRLDHIFDRFFVFKKILVRISISTNRLEEIQRFFSRLMLNSSSLVCTKKFMNEDHVIVERVFQFLIDYLDFEIFSFADSLLGFIFDERSF
jgi:hypothetical protein